MINDRPLVVHVATVHVWDDSRVFRRMCLSLARNGYDVVLAAIADAPRTVEGVRILPVPRTRSRWARVLVNLPRVAALGWSLRGDVYHVHDPELIPLIPLFRLRGAKVVYDAHEDLPRQILEKEYIPGRIRPVVAALGRLLCLVADRTADAVIAASPKVAEQYRAATVIRNYPEELPAGRDAPDYADRDHVVVYAGGLTRARGVEQMVDAMQYAGLPEDWRLVLVGPHSPDDFVERLRKRPGWSRVEYGGEVAPPEARRLIGSGRIGLAVLQPIGQNVDVLPTKLFEYMSAGVPVVSSDYPSCREVVEGTGCGLVVDPTDPREIGKAIERLASRPEEAREMGERGRAEVSRHFNWAAEEKSLLAVYAWLLGERAGRPG